MGSAYASYLTFVTNTKLLYLQSSPSTLSGPYTLMSLELGQMPQTLGQVGAKADAALDVGLVAAGNSSPLVAVDYGNCTDGPYDQRLRHQPEQPNRPSRPSEQLPVHHPSGLAT